MWCDGSLTKTVKSKLFQAIQHQIKVLSAPMDLWGHGVATKDSIYLETFGALSHYLISLQEDFKGILQSSLLCHRSVPRKLNQTDGNEQTKNKRFYANRCQETKAMFAETIQEITSISDKNCGKNYIILCFSPLPPLNNVEE